jgi:hypothetical protein
MRGLLKTLFAGIGCLAVFTVSGLVAWQYRSQIVGLYDSVARRDGGKAGEGGQGRAKESFSPPQDLGGPTGRPSAQALQSAQRKQEAIASAKGPAYVVLTANEMASLIAGGLTPVGRQALDSISVTLGQDRFELRAALKTAMLGSGLLGPLSYALNPWEPVRVSGPARVAGVGVAAWQPDSFAVRSFPFPRSAVPLIVNRLTGRPDGLVPIPVPATVGDLRIRPDGVTFYRR